MMMTTTTTTIPTTTAVASAVITNGIKAVLSSPPQSTKITIKTTFKIVDIYKNNTCKIFNENSLGFNIIGGYLTDIPATIFDVLNASDDRLNRIEEGDIIVEINGINIKNLSLNEVFKQLRCCGNRVILKLKSDPEYKLKFNELKKHKYKDLLDISSNALIPQTSSTIVTSPTKITFSFSTTQSPIRFNMLTSPTTINNASDDTINKQKHLSSNLIKNASKSCDNYINDCLNDTTNMDDNVDSLIALPTTSEPAVCITPTKVISPSSSSSASSSSSSSSTSSSSSSPNYNQINGHFYDNNFNVNNNCDSNGNCNNNNQTFQQQQQSAIHAIATSTMPIMTTITTTLAGIQTPITPSVANGVNTSFNIEIDETTRRKIDEKLKDCSSESDSEINIYTPKAVDLPSAQRLAKRLYYLDGFKANDVVRHLSKKNDFSQLVADEYLKLFNFQGLTLDAALRKFLKQFQLVGDAQEKERVLMYFAKHYVDSNETAFNDVDSCHTLTCAIMLLNTDLHDHKVENKMTLTEFIENLKGLNSGGNFSDILLESLYNAIKNEPLECASIDVEDIPFEDRVGTINGASNGNGNYQMRSFGCNPFLQLPDPQLAKEYKCGWLLRKCCIEPDGKKAPFLKRSWKMFYASLRDMVLYLHKDDKGFKLNSFDNISNAIRIHHAYASVASDYKKKQFVFRLKTADWAEYLFQTANTTELNEWINIINLVAAMFSSPALASPVGSVKTFQRPLLPGYNTRYTLQEQYDYIKKHVRQIQIDFNKLEATMKQDDKSFDKDKYNYLLFEIQRYTTYLKLLEEKLNQEHLLQTTTITNNHLTNSIVDENIVISNDILKVNNQSPLTSAIITQPTIVTTSATASNNTAGVKKILNNTYVN